MKKYVLGTAFLALTTTPAFAGTPIKLSETITLKPTADARLRYEHVDQDLVNLDADAVTARLRAGLELTFNGNLSFLAEGEGTIALVEDYNSTTNGKIGYSTIADPENYELNRLQMQYKAANWTATVGRQRINLDDQRFVGSVGWRDNEQTFDALRVETKVAGFTFDGTYAWTARSIFGRYSGTRQSFPGDMILLNAGTQLGPVLVKGFGYMVEQEERPVLSSQTFGLRASGTVPVGNGIALNFAGSYAKQDEYKNNPIDYSADYIAAELGLGYKGFGITAGYEELGSDDGVAAFQTPLATGHKFQGWADIFLTTPPGGVRDYYATLSAKFPQVKALPGLNASVTYHKFESDFGGVDYGDEWDASIGFKVLKSTSVLFKYANYDRDSFATDTEKFWVQLEWSY